MRSIAWSCLGLCLLVGCELLEGDPGSKPAAVDERAPKVGRALDIAALDLPTAPPFVGGPGVDAHGYPLAQPDQLALLNLLRLRRFEQLDGYMAHYQDEFEADFRKEYWPDTALSAFFTHEPKLGELIEEWVAHSPKSFAAHAARGNYRFQLGQRGRRFDPKVLDQAKADFQAALALRPKYVAAQRRMLQLATFQTDTSHLREQLDWALEQCPNCYIPRAFHMPLLRPGPGGSYEPMIAFANEVAPLVEQNPKLGLLAGYVDWDRCHVALVADQPELARPACAAALTHGDEPRFLITAAQVERALDDDAAALPLLDRALAILPLEEDALALRYATRLELGDKLGAGRDLLSLQHLDPLESNMPERISHMVDTLRFEGQELGKAGKHVEAAEYFALGLKLAPSDEDMMQREAFNQKSIGFDDAKRQLAAAPNDFALHLRIDHGLAASGRFADVVTMWDGFIAAHPEDPRPYVERGGAKWHLRQHEAAIEDMAKGCHYGLESACADVLNMRKRLRR